MGALAALALATLVAVASTGRVLAAAAAAAAAATNPFIVRQRSAGPGPSEVYLPYVLWDTLVQATNDALSYPLALQSSKGLLDIVLTVRAGRVSTKAFDFSSRLFCYLDICSAPAPTLYVKPGDRVRVKLINELSRSGSAGANRTNIVFKSFPLDSHINSPFVSIDGGETIQYDFLLPASTPPGVHWYGSIVQGLSAMHIMGGLAGVFYILAPDVLVQPIPAAFSALKTNLLVFSHVCLEPDGREVMTDPSLFFSLVDDQRNLRLSTLSLSFLSATTNSTLPLRTSYHALSDNRIHKDMWLVNGGVQPIYRLQPMEWRLLDLVTLSGDRALSIDIRTALGHGAGSRAPCDIQLVQRDGRAFSSSRAVAGQLVLMPGERAQIYLRCSQRGLYFLQTSVDWEAALEEEYQLGSSQLLVRIAVQGAEMMMDPPPQNLSFLLPRQGASLVVGVTNVSLSTVMPHDTYLLGRGVNCQPACFDDKLCAALFGTVNYTTQTFPTSLGGQCSYGRDEQVVSSTSLRCGEALVTTFGGAEFPFPLCFDAEARFRGHENVHGSISNIVGRDRYSPVDGSTLFSSQVLGAEEGDYRDCWPAFIGKTILHVEFGELSCPVKRTLFVTTSVLKFLDWGVWTTLGLQFGTPSPSLPPVPAPSPPPTPSPVLPLTPPDSVIQDADSAPRSLLCDTAGLSSQYSEGIFVESGMRSITSSSCPNHYALCQSAECGGAAKTRALRLPGMFDVALTPRLRSQPLDMTCSSQPVGVALNGVPLMSQSDSTLAPQCVPLEEYARLTGVASTARFNFSALALGRTVCTLPGGHGAGVLYCGHILRRVGTEVDKCAGFAPSQGGNYRYHSLPTCLHRQLSLLAFPSVVVGESKHSVQLGWALDGFPVYGPRTIKGIQMLPCTHLGAHPQLCLDSCGGYHGQLRGVDEFLYRYYLPSSVSGAQGNGCSATVDSLGTCQRIAEPCCSSALPLLPHMGCMRGCLLSERDCWTTSSAGVTSAYVAKTSTGGLTANAESFSVSSAHPESATPQLNVSISTAQTVPAVNAAAIMRRLLLTADPLTRLLQLSEVTADGEVRSQTLPRSSEDAYIRSMVLMDSTLFFTTQSRVMALNPASGQLSEVAGALVEVSLFGHNLGTAPGDVLQVKVGGAACTSFATAASGTALRALCTSSAALQYSRAYNALSPEQVLDAAAAVDVEVLTTAGTARGLSLGAYQVLVGGSARPVLSAIHLAELPFAPVAVAALEGLLYVTSVAPRLGGVLRMLMDGSQVEFIAHNVAQGTGLQLVADKADQALALLPANSLLPPCTQASYGTASQTAPCQQPVHVVLVADAERAQVVRVLLPPPQATRAVLVPRVFCELAQAPLRTAEEMVAALVDLRECSATLGGLSDGEVTVHFQGDEQASTVTLPRALLMDEVPRVIDLRADGDWLYFAHLEGLLARAPLAPCLARTPAVLLPDLPGVLLGAEAQGFQVVARAKTDQRLTSLAPVPAVLSFPPMLVAVDCAGHGLLVTSLATLSEPMQRFDLSARGLRWPAAVLVRAQDEATLHLWVAELAGRIWALDLLRDDAGRVDFSSSPSPVLVVDLSAFTASILLRAAGPSTFIEAALLLAA